MPTHRLTIIVLACCLGCSGAEPIKTGLTPAICSTTKQWFAISFKVDEEENYGAAATFPISESKSGGGIGEVTLKKFYIRPDYGGCPHCDGGGSIALCGSCNTVNCLGSLEQTADASGQYHTCGKCGVKSLLERQPITLDGSRDF